MVEIIYAKGCFRAGKVVQGMSIGFYGRYGGIYESRHSAYKIPESQPKNAAPAAVQEKADEKNLIQENQSLSAPHSIEMKKISGEKELENFMLGFYPGKDADLIGTQSDIRSLDVQKAISDMKKDRILEEYQYFVGSVREAENDTEDGIVIRKPAVPEE